MKKQLGRVWHFISKSDSIDVAAASDHIVELRERKESLESAADEARAVLAERRQYLDSADTIATFAEEMSEFLATSELTETKAFVHSFVKEIQVKPGKAGIIYSMPTPDDSPIGGADSAEIALNGGVRKSVRHGGRGRNRTAIVCHYAATISFGLPFEPEDFQYGESRLRKLTTPLAATMPTSPLCFSRYRARRK